MVSLHFRHRTQATTQPADVSTSSRVNMPTPRRILNSMMRGPSKNNAINLMHVENPELQTKLRQAIQTNNIDEIPMLAIQGAQVDAPHNGQTPLAFAIQSGAKQAVLALLESGADINNPSGDEQNSPLMIAIESNQDTIAQLLIELNADVHLENSAGDTAMHKAAAIGQTHTMQLLKNRQADIDALNYSGMRPLHAAVQSENVASIDYLVDQGSPFNHPLEDLSPLHLAIRESKPNALNYLIAMGADINAQTQSDKNTPLHDALEANDEVAITLLMENKADLTLKNTSGRTAVDLIIQKNQADLFVGLLTSNQLKDTLGDALRTIAQHGSQDCFDMLIEHMHQQPSNNPFRSAMNDQRYLLQQFSNVLFSKDDQSRTAMHIAAANGHNSIIEGLSALGISVDLGGELPSYDGTTTGQEAPSPLHAALEAKQYDTVSLLASKGAGLYAPDRNNLRPLDKAIINKDTKMVERLLTAGVNSRLPNIQGQPPLALAYSVASQPIIDLLKLYGA